MPFVKNASKLAAVCLAAPMLASTPAKAAPDNPSLCVWDPIAMPPSAISLASSQLRKRRRVAGGFVPSVSSSRSRMNFSESLFPGIE